MTQWWHTTLGEVIHVKHGYAFKGEFFAGEGEELVLTPGNFPIGGGLQFREGKERYYTASYPSEFCLSPGQLLIVMTDLKQTAPILGSPAFVPLRPRLLHNQRLGLVTPRPEVAVDMRFLYYLLLSDLTRSQLRATATGSTVRHTAPERIYRVRVSLPPLPVQRAIGSFLGSLDDLMENNRRRITLLERMVRALYREWFVCFRYPGYDGETLEDSPLGQIPMGWNTRQLGERFDIVLGGTPSRRNLNFWKEGTVPWINSGRVNDLRIVQPSEMITDDALAKSAAKLMSRRTTVLAITGATLGQVSMLEIDACANQSVVGITDSQGELAEYLYLAMVHRIGEVISHASGGAQQHINKAVVEQTRILLPSASVATQFADAVKPGFDAIAQLLRMNRSLISIRDMLLPKLVAGQIDLTALDVDRVLGSVG